MTAAAREIYDQALAYEARGDLQRALTGYLRASELLPHDTEIAYRAGSALLRTGQLEEAQSRLRRIIFAEPTHNNARSSLANCQLLLNDLDLAESNFREVLDQIPDHKNALYGLANVLVKRGRATAALPVAQKLQELMPGSAVAMTLLAEIQEKAGQSTQAIAIYRKVLKTAPDHIPALLGLAEALLKSKRVDEVVALTVRIAEQAPDEVSAYEMMSQALEARGDLQDALEAGQEAARLNPENMSQRTRLSVLCRKLGKYPDALRYALEAHDAAPDGRGPLNALGSALAALKHSKEARAVLTTAAGTGLAPEIRSLAEDLAKGSSAPTGTEPESRQGSRQSSAAGPVIEKPAEENKTNSPEITGEASPEAVSPADNAGAAIATPPAKAALGPGKDDPLPNVLGLTRRDMS